MKNYKISFSNGTAWLVEKMVKVEDYENEQNALDKMIDELEAEGCECYFIDYEDTYEEGGEYFEDEYVIGGNHGRLLLHYGDLRIELV